MKNITRKTATLVTAAAFLVPLACSSAKMPTQAAQPSDGGVDYQITFASQWTPQTHPLEYPEAGALTGPHFSGLIGAAHNGSLVIFKEGMPPTPGLERLSEEGKHSPLDEEIKTAIKDGKGSMLFETGPLKDFSQKVTGTVHVNDQNAMVSFVAMIAPSPDWFTGADNVPLKENGAWVASKTVSLYAWDSGGDDGTTYKADDMDTNPKKPTMMAGTPHFVINGTPVPVATVTFTRM